MDRLSRILVDIRRAPHEVDDTLRDYMESEARDLSGEELTRFMQSVYSRVHGLIQRCPSIHPILHIKSLFVSHVVAFLSSPPPLPPSEHILYRDSWSRD